MNNRPTNQHLTSFVLGLCFSVAAFTNALLVGPLQRRFKGDRLIVACMSALAVCFTALTFIDTYEHLLVLMVPITIASTVLYTMAAAMLSNSVGQDETGTAVSISHSVRSFTGVIAPPVGGILFTRARIDGIGFSSGTLAALAAFVFVVLSTGARADSSAETKKTS